MKKTLSILLLLCMAFATAFAVVSCGKTQSKDKLSPEERAAVDEVMKSLYSAPEKKDEGVYEENEYGIAMTYEYDKNRNLVKVYQGEAKATAILEYDEKDRLAKVSVKNAEGKSTATYVMTYTDRGFISEIAGEIANNESQYSRKTSFVYDEKDRVIKNEVVQSDETVQLIEVTYDEKARVITMTGNWEYSKTGFKAVATYNEDWKAIKNERFDENGTPVYVTEFDGNGNTIRSTNYDENGKPSWSYGYEYDEDGKKIKETSYKEDGSISMIYRYEYDEKGNLTKEARCDETETLRAYDVYEYDENGYVLKMTQYSAGGVKTGYKEYFENTTYANKYTGERRSESYDSDGNLSSVYEYNRNGETTKSENYRNGKLWSAEENEYDENGNLIKSSSYDADRKFTSYSVYGYNESGKRIKISEYDGDDKLTGYTEIKRDGKYVLSETVYDADGNKTEYTEYLENTPDYNTYSRTKRYEKYENGKLAELREYNEDGRMTKLISYDGEGNKKLYEEYVTLKVKHNGYEGISAVIKTHETYNDGKLEHRTEYEYDENGNRTKISEYDGEGKLIEYTETKYDGERILSESRYDGNGKLIRRTEDEYDENGKKLKSSVYNNGGLEGYKSYHYNESGRLIKVTACDAYNRIVNYYEIEYTDENGNGKTHEYDKNGNLLGTYPWVIFR
ncbi:MAG: hypothetical protein EGQ30_05605 [Clostridiales bacterium]|nr:hypothetical protein [Clostridiales bacterium]